MRARAGFVALLLALLIGAGWKALDRGDSRVEASPEKPRIPSSAPAELERTQEEEAPRSGISPEAETAEAPRNIASTPRPEGPRLEVAVTFAGEPLAAAAVDLALFEDSSEFLIGGNAGEALASARTGSDGIARFQPLVAATYGLRATAPTGEQARTRLVLGPDPVLVRVEVALGRAAVEGTVHDLAGRVAVGSHVIARQDARAGETLLWFASKTDANGSYRLAGIAGGTGRPILATVIDQALGESAPFEIGPDETRRLDFGSAAGRASWSGAVRFPSGAMFLGPARMYFTSEANATSETGYIDERGRFLIVLPAGNYTAHLEGPATISLGRAEVVGAVEQDLTAPRVVLRGRVHYVGTKHPVARGPENDALVALERRTGGAIRAGFVRGDSRYAFYGLEPGSYVLTASPWIVAGAADGRAAVEIGAGTDELELDLSITDP